MHNANVTHHAPTSLVVVGAGQIGTPLVARLAREGHAVTWVSRRVPASVPRGARHVSLDASDGAALAAVAEGAHAILVAANPESYDTATWARVLPPLHEGLIEAASRSGARLVLLDALYAYALDRGPLSPGTPLEPATEKGRVRKQVAEQVREAQAAGRARITTLRASDFWGPELGRVVVNAADVQAGRTVMLFGDPDQEHAFSHRDDVVEALCALAFAADDVEGNVFHAPVIHVTPRQLVQAFAAAYGTHGRVRVLPTWVVRLAGTFSKDIRGMVEMLPQWEQPYRVDDSSYTERFGVRATSLAEGVAQFAATAQGATQAAAA